MFGFIRWKGWMAPIFGALIAGGLAYFVVISDEPSHPTDAVVEPLPFALGAGVLGFVCGLFMWIVDSLRERRKARRERLLEA